VAGKKWMLLLALLVVGCVRCSPGTPATATWTREVSATPTARVEEVPCAGVGRFQTGRAGSTEEEALRNQALAVVCALRERRWADLTRMVHPERGLCFSPDAYLDQNDLCFSREDLPRLPKDPVRYRWGFEPGSGRPLDFTFVEYAARYVYDGPYWEKGRLGMDVRQGAGNIIDNHDQVFPDSRVVEFYLPGSEQYGGLDWRSLRLVFLPDPRAPGGWWLVALVHDEWSP